MRSLWASVTLLGLGASPLVGCSCASDDGPPIDASVADVGFDAPMDAHANDDGGDADASIPMIDAGLDASEAGLDARVNVDLDAGGDAAVDAGADALDSCLACVADHDCDVATCVDGVCMHAVAADQSACVLVDSPELAAWCVAGECVEAGCGDGIVADDEACDDGNDTDDDACSGLCTWRGFSPIEETGSSLTLGRGRALAVDGLGTVLVAWHEKEVSDGPTAISVRRISASGALLDDEPMVVQSSNQGTPYPAVAGLSGGGFAFAFRMDAELHVRVLSADGTLSAVRVVANTFGVGVPSIVAVGSGFVVGWSLDGGVYAQRYDANGTTLGSRITLHSSAPSLQNLHSGIAFAADGDQWIAVWSRQQMPGAPVERSVWGRRFNAGSALDGTEQLYSTYGFIAVGHAVIARPGGWLIAFAQGTDDPSGEIYSRWVSTSGVAEDAVLESTTDDVPAVTEGGPVLCGYGDLGYFLAWHLGTQQLNARAVLGTRGLGATSPPELEQLNQVIQLGPWVSGLSCASSAAGVWVSWLSGGVAQVRLIPAPMESL